MSTTTTSLSNLAPELVESICLDIPNPRDLLSFALTCKTICEVVIPDHLELRHIRCDFRRVSLWEELVQFPAVASRIVSLELISEHTSTLDPIRPTHSKLILTHDFELDAWGSKCPLFNVDYARGMQSLTSALQTMVNLSRFHWLVNEAHPTNEALLSLSTGSSALEDFVLKLGDVEGPWASVSTTVRYLHNPIQHQTTPLNF